jgi:hypothetical protein
MPTNEHDHNQHGHGHQVDPDNPGYETTDVNVGGVSVFLAALFGFVIVFFFLCYFMGQVINSALLKEDGPVTRWNTMSEFAGAATTGGKRQDLTSNPVLQQKQLQQITSTFPEPRLDLDDGNQATADLHAHEDLLLDHYSTGENGNVRIPISRAMQLVAQRGLPVNTSAAASEPLMAGDSKPMVQAPLTSGFARTGYELDTIEAREQKMNFGKAEAAEASMKK